MRRILLFLLLLPLFAAAQTTDSISSFHAQFGMNATVGVGKHAPRGVGFGQNVALSWQQPLGDRVRFSVGGFAEHFSWGGRSVTDVVVDASVAFKVNERLNLFAFASHTFTDGVQPLPFTGPSLLYDTYSPWGLRPRNEFGVGAAFKFENGGVFSVSISLQNYEPHNLNYEPHNLNCEPLNFNANRSVFSGTSLRPYGNPYW